MAIIFSFEGKLALAAYLLIGSCFADFLDGLAARTLKVNNPIGKEIDSLTDMVAFGVFNSYFFCNSFSGTNQRFILCFLHLIIFTS